MMSSVGSRHRRGRAMPSRGVAAATLTAWVLAAALCVALPGVAGAQDGVKDWDGVTSPAYDDAATNQANSAITEAQEERDAAMADEEALDCSICYEAGEVDERREEASEATRQATAELVDARAQAIEAAPGEDGAALQEKLDALDELEGYAEDWTPDSSNEGYASTDEVEAAQAKVQAQLSAAEATASPEPTAATTEPTTAAPAGGDGGGNQGGNQGQEQPPQEPAPQEPAPQDQVENQPPQEPAPNPSGGSLLGGLNVGSLIAAALIAVGVSYFFIGLIKDGLKERVKGFGSSEQARAPRQKDRKPSGGKPKGGAEDGTRQRRAAGGEAERSEREAPDTDPGPERSPEKPGRKTSTKTKTSEPEDGSALADRLKRMRREDADPGGLSPEELDALFGHDDGEDDDGEEGR